MTSKKPVREPLSTRIPQRKDEIAGQTLYGAVHDRPGAATWFPVAKFRVQQSRGGYGAHSDFSGMRQRIKTIVATPRSTKMIMSSRCPTDPAPVSEGPNLSRCLTPGQRSTISAAVSANVECTSSASIPASTHRSEEHTSELQSPLNLVCRL